MTKASVLTRLALAASAFAAAAPAAAQIYNNGAPNSSSGNETTQWVQAEDFTFAGGANVAGAGVYLAGTNNGFLANWDGNLTYYLFDNNGGIPGTVLQTGAVTPLVSDTGTPWCCGGNAYLLQFDFLSALVAAPGATYWLGLHASTDFNRDEVYWVTTNGNSTSPGQESNGGTFTNWSSTGVEHAFYLTGDRLTGAVPEPGTWAMMLIGFGAVGFTIRRQRRAALAVA